MFLKIILQGLLGERHSVVPCFRTRCGLCIYAVHIAAHGKDIGIKNRIAAGSGSHRNSAESIYHTVDFGTGRFCKQAAVFKNLRFIIGVRVAHAVQGS